MTKAIKTILTGLRVWELERKWPNAQLPDADVIVEEIATLTGKSVTAVEDRLWRRLERRAKRWKHRP